MLANGWPAGSPQGKAPVTHWGGDHASRVLPFAAGCGFEAYPDDASWDTREESILERRSRLNAARQTRLSDLLAQITPDKDDSLEARQRRLFQIDVKSRPRSAAPKKDYAIYGPALLDVSDHRTPQHNTATPAERRLRREHALEYPLRVDLPPPDDRISVII